MIWARNHGLYQLYYDNLPLPGGVMRYGGRLVVRRLDGGLMFLPQAKGNIGDKSIFFLQVL